MTQSISVVLLSKDERQLERSLELLRPQCLALGAECLVIDASEHRLDDIRDRHPWVRWHAYQGPFWRRSTIPHQRNLGVRIAQGSIIAFCDAGGEPGENWLSSIVAPIQSGSASYVCGPIHSIGVSNYTAINEVEDGAVVDSPPTANVAFTREVFEMVDGFDQRYYYGSDVDFAYRLSLRGLRCINVKAAQMGMSWGPVSTSMKRAWRYGRAWPRAFRFQPGRRALLIRHSPERLVYSGWLLGLVPAVIVSAVFTWWIALAYALVPGLLLLKNYRAVSPWRVVAVHMVEGAAGLFEFVAGLLGEVPPVWHWSTPAADSAYQNASQRFGNAVTRFEGDRPWVSLLVPKVISARIRGLRAILFEGEPNNLPRRWKALAAWAVRLGIVVVRIDQDGRGWIWHDRDWRHAEVVVDELDDDSLMARVQVANALFRKATSRKK